ncbi:hypothetical protein QBC42DRAFT_230419 [Cladorrhinum samala]|uniref:Cytochrome b5 heme-binding domain-containing protein n=1 Tax=Cladorrhinum samala TaxID=585594 RepID=A0AAV9HLU9_9PEZI|nr:hypothetical protein QBC42DRAFT_230419 [Cladorrhinum samala]
MALIGISLIVASLVLFCIRRPAWFPSLFGGSSWQLPAPESSSSTSLSSSSSSASSSSSSSRDDEGSTTQKATADRAAMPPPPPPPMIQLDSIVSSNSEEEQTTPKATSTSIELPVPSLNLSARPPAPSSSSSNKPSAPSTSASSLMAPPPRPAAPPSLRPLPPSSSSSSSSLMPPPSRGPIPPRGAPSRTQQPGCSTLAPPPTHTSKPAKPSRAVILTPGHSPLDWARLSSGPNADLRGLPPGTPYLRVTPSMLKKMTGRKGKDAWSVFNGRVYNISPYLPFHPGGEPELLRCAGRDGTKLFGEIHPWVNYEGMLAACLVGIFVTEEEEAARGGGSAGGPGGDMEAMD